MDNGPISVTLLSKVIVWNEDGKLLVLRRSKTDPRRPLTWDFPGGLVEPGEDPRAAARRETIEEAGIDIQDLQVVDVVSTPGSDYLVAIFFEGRVRKEPVVISWEHDKYKWVAPNEVADLDIPDKYKRAVKTAMSR